MEVLQPMAYLQPCLVHLPALGREVPVGISIGQPSYSLLSQSEPWCRHCEARQTFPSLVHPSGHGF